MPVPNNHFVSIPPVDNPSVTDVPPMHDVPDCYRSNSHTLSTGFSTPVDKPVHPVDALATNRPVAPSGSVPTIPVAIVLSGTVPTVDNRREKAAIR